MERFLNIDRRIIFLLVFVAVVVSLLLKFELPVPPTEPVINIYNKIETLGENDHILLALDYDPSSKEELYPMAIALLHHCYRRNIKVLGLTLWPGGAGLAEEAIVSVAKEYGKESGKDYVYLGYKPGQASLIINMGENLYSAFPKDYYGNTTRDMPVLKGVNSLKDIDYVIDLAAGQTIETWIAYGKEKYGFEMAAGCTAVIGPDLYPFLQSGQLNGMMGGLKGAAEYESLINKKAMATRGMQPQSVVHILVIVLVIIGNVLYFTYGEKKKQTTI
ncbi:MAG: hypothetical protein ACUZ8H_09270 [Candidatus Anammoxibacter sp.]